MYVPHAGCPTGRRAAPRPPVAFGPLDCAWCLRATKRGGEWRPAARAVLLARKRTASHGICPACQGATADNWGLPAPTAATVA